MEKAYSINGISLFILFFIEHKQVITINLI